MIVGVEIGPYDKNSGFAKEPDAVRALRGEAYVAAMQGILAGRAVTVEYPGEIVAGWAANQSEAMVAEAKKRGWL